MYRKLIIQSLVGTWWALSALAAEAQIDSRDNVERAIGLIDQGDYSLARSYLAPALIDFRLSASERSRAYYLRGYSFYAEEFHVSAGKDYYRALEFNPDNPAAQAALGNLHLRGLGVERNPRLAYQLFSQAAHGGHIGAQFQIAIAELNGTGTEPNVQSARRWLENLAGQDHPAAMVHLGRSYRAGIAPAPDPGQAKIWYERAWASGDPDGLLGLAFMHQKGEFGEADADRALALIQQAAGAGSGPAQAILGHNYLTGEAVPQDYARALALFQQAAEQGTPASYAWLGHIYEAGLGVTADLAQARSWYRKGSREGVQPAQERLVYLLLASESVSDHREALGLLAKSAQANAPQAQNDYAWVLATHPQPALRDGALALEFAAKAVAHEASATYLDTLAAAQAELGEFAAAIATQKAALQSLGDGHPELAAELQAHLAEYVAGKPWRE